MLRKFLAIALVLIPIHSFGREALNPSEEISSNEEATVELKITPTPTPNPTPSSSSKPLAGLKSSPGEDDLEEKDEATFPIDQLEASFKKRHSSPHARQLKEAHAAVMSKQYLRAIKFAASSVKDPTFMDYGLWLSIQAYRGLAQAEIEQKKYSSALKFAEKATQFALKLEEECAYSPFLKNIPLMLAQSEAITGEVFWHLKKFPQAQSHFERAFQRFQSANSIILLKPPVLSHYAQICKANQTAFCVSWLRKLLAAFSKQSSAEQAILKEFTLSPEKRSSYRILSRVPTPYKSLDQDAIAFEAAMKLYFDNKFADAQKAFEQLLNDFPRTSYKNRVRYWLAQSISRSQGSEPAKKVLKELQAEFPLTYYGLLASQETGVPVESALNASLPVAQEKETSLSPQEIFHLKRAENFIAESANDLAAFELKDFRPRETFSSPFLVYLALLTHKAQTYSLLFSVLSELLQRGADGVLSAYGLHLIFPYDYYKLVAKNSSEVHVDPILVMSLIKQESSFDKSVSSPVGAIGLMQLMPHTALETDPSIALSDLFEADENIRVGVRYLNKLLARYNGNIVYAVGAYNAGPAAMDRWIKAAPSKRGMIEFIESITYRETREYVCSIIRNYFWYTRRIKGESALNLSYFWNADKM